MASTARNRTRVILHVDLDAFYCQVEMKRVGIPAHVPCAVQQWEGLIAVNYPARAAGITRHMRRAEAKAKCPELQCVHVETIGGDAGAGSDSAVTWEDRKTQKACLERYRVASAEIIAVFHEVAPDAIVEKASIDEAYLDVTSIVDAHLRASDGEGSLPASSAQLPALESPGCGNHVIGGALDLGSEFERRLAVGSQLACQLRAAVKDKLGYTCSAGIACNKLMAKIASAMHKPNQQTVIPPRALPDLMKDMPLKKIRNFGGKLGAELQTLGCSTAGEVLALAPATLHQHFGDRAPWILYTVQGNSDEPVQVKERPKSMLAAKSFEPSSDMAALERWVTILAEELAERMAADNKLFNRRPKSLHLHYRGGGGGGWGSGDRSKSCPMPRFLKAGPTAPVICETVMRLFQKCPDALPCTRLAVAASDFEDGPLSEGQGSITKFFGAGSGTNTAKGEASCRRADCFISPNGPMIMETRVTTAADDTARSSSERSERDSSSLDGTLHIQHRQLLSSRQKAGWLFGSSSKKKSKSKLITAYVNPVEQAQKLKEGRAVDLAALLELKQLIHHRANSVFDTWVDNGNPCNFAKVACDQKTGRVSEIDLIFKEDLKSLYPELQHIITQHSANQSQQASIASVKRQLLLADSADGSAGKPSWHEAELPGSATKWPVGLYPHDDLIIDSLPSGTAFMKLNQTLRALHISNAVLSSPTLPAAWDQFEGLRELTLNGLDLEGTLPASWAGMINMTQLLLGDNPKLSGSLPPEWGAMEQLKLLDLSLNYESDLKSGISGILPPSWSRMVKLETLDLWRTSVDGPLPPSWAAMKHLQARGFKKPMKYTRLMLADKTDGTGSLCS
ncbi:hypothetical protein WJX82_011225 [Trebouxia sp. C0006]